MLAVTYFLCSIPAACVTLNTLVTLQGYGRVLVSICPTVDHLRVQDKRLQEPPLRSVSVWRNEGAPAIKRAVISR